MKKRGQTIKQKIVNGYWVIVAIICVLIIGALLCLTAVERGYKDIVHYRAQQNSAQSVITSHYKWLEQLNTSILNNVEFEGSLDPETCSLGKWLSENSPESMNDDEISRALDQIITPHEEIHAKAADLVKLASTDKQASYESYITDIKPRVHTIDEGLTTIIDRYDEISDEKTASMQRVVVFSFLLCGALGILAVVMSLLLAGKLSDKISKPVSMVTEWSEALATGIENLKWDDEKTSSFDQILEIERMTNAFKKMVQGIQHDVSVIRRVAQGDMTVYVDIKSDGDVLGQNLYHLVQSNDLMFANLLEIAQAVADSAQDIAKSSQYQAEQSMTQAMAVENLSHTVSKANDLAVENNAKRAHVAADVSGEIKEDIKKGADKMSMLLSSVDEIKTASENILGVMKAIDDIAFQTNILALNAAVEAARAGDAEKASPLLPRKCAP